MNKLVVFSLLCAGMPLATTNGQSANELWQKMVKAMNNIRTVTYQVTTAERIDGALERKETVFRLQSTPLKVYGRNMNSGIEFLYVQGWNNNKAYVNPNGFPWMNLSLNIYSNQMREDNHHTVNHAGFGYMQDLFTALQDNIEKQGKSFESCVQVRAGLNWDDQNCYRVELNVPNYSIKDYKCTRTETLHHLCERLHLPEYRVMELNKLNYTALLKEGQTIKVPTAYAKRVVLYVDQKNYLPIVQMIYDDNGLYEKYEYRKLQLNPRLHQNEWTPECTGYAY